MQSFLLFVPPGICRHIFKFLGQPGPGKLSTVISLWYCSFTGLSWSVQVHRCVVTTLGCPHHMSPLVPLIGETVLNWKGEWSVLYECQKDKNPTRTMWWPYEKARIINQPGATDEKEAKRKVGQHWRKASLSTYCKEKQYWKNWFSNQKKGPLALKWKSDGVQISML